MQRENSNFEYKLYEINLTSRWFYFNSLTKIWIIRVWNIALVDICDYLISGSGSPELVKRLFSLTQGWLFKLAGCLDSNLCPCYSGYGPFLLSLVSSAPRTLIIHFQLLAFCTPIISFFIGNQLLNTINKKIH